jgi:hypothetical protein
LSPSSKSWQRQRLTSRPAMPITCSWIGSKFAPSLWACYPFGGNIHFVLICVTELHP